jgi:hypothetical protein
MSDWTPKQHIEHQQLMSRMERERIDQAEQAKRAAKREDDQLQSGGDLNPANSAHPNAGKRKKKVRRKKKVSS